MSKSDKLPFLPFNADKGTQFYSWNAKSPHPLQWLPPPSTPSIMPTSLPFSYNFPNSTTGPVASILFLKHRSYSAINDNEIMPLTITRMDLEIIIISKPMKTNKISLICGI